MKTLCPLHQQSEQYPEGVALRSPESALSFAELDTLVSRYEAALQSKSLGQGDVLALLSDNSADYISLLLACFRQKIAVLPLNKRLMGNEWDEQLKSASAKLVVYGDNEIVSALVPSIEFNELLAAAPSAPAPDTTKEVSLTSPATLMFTSGSSGHSKCVKLSLENYFASAKSSNEVTRLKLEHTWLLSLPLYHVAGLGIVFRCLLAGAAIEIPDSNSVSGIKSVLATSTHITHISLLPSMLGQILDEEQLVATLERLQFIMLGGAPSSAHLLQRIKHSNLAVHTSYGMTETCSHITLTRPEDGMERIEACGRALPGVELEIQNEEGQTLPEGELGEIAVRGKVVFESYLDPKQEKRTKNGWFLTSDLGHVDEHGALHVKGRREEMIISGGENIHLSEISECAEKHPGVGECVVISVPDARWGQRPALFFTEAASRPLSELELHEYFFEALAAMKRPEQIVKLESLPRTAIGKADVQKLHELLAGGICLK